jgi:hypothetical protein
MKKIISFALLILICSCSVQHIPDGVNIIEEKTSSSDHFGDYSYCAKIKINEKNLKELKQKGFSWFPAHIEKKLKTPNWKTEKIPEEIIDLINGIDVHLTTPPIESKIYEYIYQWEDG